MSHNVCLVRKLRSIIRPSSFARNAQAVKSTTLVIRFASALKIGSGMMPNASNVTILNFSIIT